ncbi:retrovirus-related pol polyprotein from transposon TNT 1-94 [Tanacetum coccineum]
MTQSPYQTHQNSYQNTQFQSQASPYQSPQYGSPYQSQQYSTHQSSTPLSITYPSNDYQSSIHHNVYSPSSSIPQLECAPTVNQQSEFSQPDSGLIVPVFQKGDDPTDSINHMMSFLTAIGRQTSLVAGTSRTYTPGVSGSNSEKQRTVICFNCKGEGHMSKQCTKPKRKQDDSWFKDKANGQILHEEELAFLANPKNCISHHTDSHYSICCLSKPNDLDAIITLIVMKLNSICQDLLHGKFISYGSDAPQAGYHNQDNVDNNRLYQAVFRRCRRSDIKCYNHSETEITSDSNIIPLFSVCDRITTGKTFRILTHSAQQDALILSVIEH